MRKFYISKREGESGIYKYSEKFYELILRQRGYIFLDSSAALHDILLQISVNDKVHIEIGIFLNDESRILFKLIEKGYSDVSITLHDAPLIKFPFFGFNNVFLNNVSKFYDLYVDCFSYQKKYLKKIKNIYVLTHKGVKLMQSKYQLKNVFFLPHIIDESEVKKSKTCNFNFIYMGYVGKNKGLKYSLLVHQQLLQIFPEAKFYIAGKALGKQKKFYEELKANFKDQTYFMDFVNDTRLNELFDETTFSFLLFKDYKFYVPFSGSILYALKMGKIVFTNNTNAVSEVIKNGETGIYLSGKLKNDVAIIKNVLQNLELQERIKSGVYNYLATNHTTKNVVRYYKY